MAASGTGEIDMSKHVTALVWSITLMALPGCATHEQPRVVARLTESDERPSALSSDLVGIWNGSFWPLGADAGGWNALGYVTFTIKDDGTYTVATRRGTSTRTYSGVVIAKGGTITLRSSAGGWYPLKRRGDVLYGVVRDTVTGYTLGISMEKRSGALVNPPSKETGPGGERP
jgi:hypothetical protein